MWLSLLASVVLAQSGGAPRRVQPASFVPPPRPVTSPFAAAPTPRFTAQGNDIVLDGWAFYARAGGMVVATGESTKPFVYGCETRWDYDTPFCRIGRSTMKMPNHFFIVLGMTFVSWQDAVRKLRADMVSTKPRYSAKDIISDGRFNLRALVAVLPLISFSVLENGAYGNLLVSL
jgi:hypothetical protein